MASTTLPIVASHSLLPKSNFLGLTHTLKAPSSNTPPSPISTLKVSAKFNLFEILGGRGLLGEVGLEEELKKYKTIILPQEPPTTTDESPESTAAIVPEDAFGKELLGLTGGFPGGEKGLQKFIEENPPPKKGEESESSSSSVDEVKLSLVKKPKVPEFPILIHSSSASSVVLFTEAHPTHEKFLNKRIEMYDEMSLVLGKDCATGSFAKSFIDVDLEARSENEVLHVDGDVRSEVSSQPRQHRKRTRDKYDGDASLALISEKLGAMADAITRLTGDRLNVQVLHDEIMAMDGFDEFFLGSAFDYLVQHEMLAKAFLAKRDNLRRAWLDNFANKF